MQKPAIDPAPRTYAQAVSLVRRSARGAAAAPPVTTFTETQKWLLEGAMLETDLLSLFESLVWRLVASGSTLVRASLHVGTLHPQLIGFAWNWNRFDGLCDEVKVAAAALQSDAFRRNPLQRVIDLGERFRADARDARTRERYPLLADLAAAGITEYIAEPLMTGSSYHNAVTLATTSPEGFGPDEQLALEAVLRLLALHVERQVLTRVAKNVLDTYLGGAVGDAVLAGSIKRGSGAAIRSVIWCSDMRGFTDLTDRLAGGDVTALLNAYFECLVVPIVEKGGEVLKFIGDGLLATFRYHDEATARIAAASALAAAESGLAAVDRLNDAPPAELARIDDWRPLRSGISLHAGEVFFGNIGSSERLDFTVIGRAVNEAARVEALTKALGHPLLITEAVAPLLARPLVDLGAQNLRGRADSMRVYRLAAPGDDAIEIRR